MLDNGLSARLQRNNPISEFTNQLRDIATADDFARLSGELVEAWRAAKVGVEAIDPILQFMEEHPTLDFGMPGPLVHFVESFYERGYEERLVESIYRQPTATTVWMLNRVINGTRLPARKQRLISILKQAAENSKADQQTLERIHGFLNRFDSME